jgi:2-polyprenyl-3-methyl-5-hydroxy-6-metoxy-1,4-benzoquinol methylase
MTLAGLYASKQHPAYFSSVRDAVLPLVRQRAARVLDLGCGDGATLELLKAKGLAEWSCGVDIHADALGKAKLRGVDKVIEANLDSLTLPFGPDSLDLILCLDVLEHLVDPWAVLRRVVTCLKPGGAVVASIPNVQNLRVIGPLMIGRWQYRDCGILDQGHLRFFTRSAAIELLRDAGLTVEVCVAQIEPHWLPRAVNQLTFTLLERFITVQFLLRAVKQ